MATERTVVLKFGGSAVAKASSFARVAELIVEQCSHYARVVVVVSAMSGVTDTLDRLARTVHPDPPRREYDMLVSVGERMSGALLAMALQRLGKDAVSFTGSQSGIITSGTHCDAQIVEVRPVRLQQALVAGRVVVVAGFQGVSAAKEITTLGRGGSDTSAVALAASLGAEEVIFYKDVEGVYPVDPKKQPGLKPYSYLSYEEMMYLIRQGAGVLHRRAVSLAAEKRIVLLVRSHLVSDAPGTTVGMRASCYV